MADLNHPTHERPLGLILLVIYRAGTAVVLLLTAVALRLARLHHVELSEYTLLSHRFIVTWMLQHLAQISPHTLQFATIAAGLYSLLSAVEAFGLWYKQSWARWLLLLGVGASLPLEAFELLHAASWLKLGLLAVNSLAFWYVLRRFPQR